MAVDSFFRSPFRTSKSGGTKCTTCEITTDCNEATKCLYPLLCVSFNIPSCGYNITLVNASQYLGAVRYDCDLQAFDLSFLCGGYTIDLLLTYEIVSGSPSAVLRSNFLNIEVAHAFTDSINARCPSWEFNLGNGESVVVRKYELVSIGQQKCINSGPDDCTSGRCLPKRLCANVYTLEDPGVPLHTTLEWFTNDTVQVDDVCCCNANRFPTTLVARVVNFSDGCTCIAPKRTATQYYTAEQAGNQIVDPGAILHLHHKIAYASDAFVSGYPNVPEGSNVWVSEGILAETLVPVCPSPDQVTTPYTLDVYARLILWCDPVVGSWQACFEIVNYTDSVAASNSDYVVPFNVLNPYSNVYRITDGVILCCNPFQIRLSGIVETEFCQDTDSVNGTGRLELLVGEFQGWVGPSPVDSTKRITLYSERINTAAPVQTIASDCLPKLHIQTSLNSFKERTDEFSISRIWPEHVYSDCEFLVASQPPYHNIQRIVVYPESCTGCEQQPPVDTYGPVNVNCCAEPVPRVLYATAIEDNDCPCASGTVVVLTYDDTEEAWFGTATFGGTSGCGTCSVNMRLGCADLIGSSIWQLEWGFGGRVDYLWTPQAPVNDPVFSCTPFYWVTRNVSSNTCCNPSFAASLFHWVITE